MPEETTTISFEDLDHLYGVLLAYSSIAEGSIGVGSIEPVLWLIGITPERRKALHLKLAPVIEEFQRNRKVASA